VLEVTFYRDDGDRWCGILARGHTDFAAHGTDIVCAAVSAILQAARLGLTQYGRAGVAARQEPGELELDWGEDQCDLESVQAIVTTAQLAIDQIARRFPKHVRLRVTRIAPMVGGKASDRVTES
jgi:uncharacterized protein YsxB (DUF464 family)